ncbi:gamma-glutamylcyclotransferase (GGCT)/AIG2-like uncharacterized protein YtfP/cation transport regulator ChaC [Kroppenstedtia sanguinis]|uniref:gamma-glutamylcyclotransferase n=1 Tax=Kroppenstedtia sanguinis TaxID=1380684 RepID=UPI003D1A4566
MDREWGKLFVYGTWRRGEKHHHLLKNAKLMALQAWTDGKLLDDPRGGGPVLGVPGEQRVYGELYRVDRETLNRLDELTKDPLRKQESFGEYRRIRRRIQSDRGAVEADVYIHTQVPAAGGRKVSYRDWKGYHLEEQREWLYFAYGSCMDDERFYTQGVEEHFRDVIGRGVLKGHAMRYTLPRPDGGRADLVEHPKSVVEGKVYRVGARALAYLFWREGVDDGTYRPAWIPVEIEGKTVENVLTFIVIQKGKETPPPEHYAREILRGSQDIVSERYHRHLRRRLKKRFGMTVKI